jgi:hypothetical protein
MEIHVGDEFEFTGSNRPNRFIVIRSLGVNGYVGITTHFPGPPSEGGMSGLQISDLLVMYDQGLWRKRPHGYGVRDDSTGG